MATPTATSDAQQLQSAITALQLQMGLLPLISAPADPPIAAPADPPIAAPADPPIDPFVCVIWTQIHAGQLADDDDMLDVYRLMRPIAFRHMYLIVHAILHQISITGISQVWYSIFRPFLQYLENDCTAGDSSSDDSEWYIATLVERADALVATCCTVTDTSTTVHGPQSSGAMGERSHPRGYCGAAPPNSPYTPITTPMRGAMEERSHPRTYAQVANPYAHWRLNHPTLVTLLHALLIAAHHLVNGRSYITDAHSLLHGGMAAVQHAFSAVYMSHPRYSTAAAVIIWLFAQGFEYVPYLRLSIRRWFTALPILQKHDSSVLTFYRDCMTCFDDIAVIHPLNRMGSKNRNALP